MKHRLTRAAAALAAAFALVFAAPAVAHAYTPDSPTGEATITITSSGTYDFAGFAPNTSVSASLSGENAAGASLAAVKFAVTSTSITKTTDAAGNVSVAVTLPADASGSYTLTVAAVSGSGTGTLPSTGGDSDSLLGIWVGGGALLLAGATIAVATTVRRNRQQTRA